jgi:DNA (cytosine-5)-methyltransferase 1
MHALGYALAPMVLDAADHGVPQHRRRLFIVGTRSKHPIELQAAAARARRRRGVIDFAAGRWSPSTGPAARGHAGAHRAEGRRTLRRIGS